MSFSSIHGKGRQVIPRWHTYALARWLGVVVSTGSHRKIVADDNYFEKVDSWKAKGGLAQAADLVGNALVLNCFEDKVALEAASFILENKGRATKPLVELTTNFLRLARKCSPPVPEVDIPERDHKFYRVISNLKARLREYPHNPILWMDMAFYYSGIGQAEAAENAVIVALSLNKENRYLLRSGSRFFMHIGSPDTALHFLRESNIGEHDPWVVAAEVAISDTLDSPSKRIKIAKKLIENRSIPTFHLSELASALGTIELKNGATRKGKRLFNLALEKPTENTLAQATFLRDIFGAPIKTVDPEQLAQSFEAQARLKFQDQDFEGALEAAEKWFAYQPFSSRPTVFGSYVASVALGRFDDAVRIARLGQLASPRDVMLRNNLAFALASLGEISQARTVLDSIAEPEINESEKHVIVATRATIEFRNGNVEDGRNLYKTSVDFFRRKNDLMSATIAAYFWAREEGIIKSPGAENTKEAVLDAAKSLKLYELIASSKTDPAFGDVKKDLSQ